MSPHDEATVVDPAGAGLPSALAEILGDVGETVPVRGPGDRDGTDLSVYDDIPGDRLVPVSIRRGLRRATGPADDASGRRD